MAIATEQLFTNYVNDYESDFYAWTQNQAQILRDRQWQLIDIQHLAEEIEDMGHAEKRELESRLEVLLMHLLKWQFQSDRRCRSWQLTIKEQRLRLHRHLKQNPSLKSVIPEVFADVYQLAVVGAAKETGLDIFPDICPYTFEQVILDVFLPD